jgi:eukaryotic-like serine/threonine-protein kinase
MPPPVTAAEFLTIVEKSGLLQKKDLDGYRSRSVADPTPPDQVANRLVVDGRLTPFQVEILLAGKYRPFFVGPYKVLSRIGNGSMGVVYLCEHRGMRRRVALKVLQKRRARDEVALERFLREARAAAALSHPNVVHALDVGCENELHYLVMEYIAGKSLKQLILSEGPLPPLKAADYLRQAASGVQHAHDAGLIHRDIKPSNLMIDRSGVVKLLDLGLARFDEVEFSLTRGATIGDAAYIAPEQMLDSHAVDARADIYSLGATFHLALVGRPLIPGLGIPDADPSQQSDTTDFSRLMAVLRRMTALEPANRYQTADEVAAELAAWVTQRPPMAIAVPPSESDADALANSEPSATPLSFDSSPTYKPRDISRAEIPVKGWWSVRQWQLLILGLAVIVGILAALVGSARSTSASGTPTKLAPNQ